MAIHFTSYTQELDQYFSKRMLDGVRGFTVYNSYPTTKPWEPIKYDSMTSFMILNYLLLTGITALVFEIAKAIYG